MPDNLKAFNDLAAAKYSDADLYRFLADYKLQRDIGAQWDYSNIGYWLLSQPWLPEPARITRACCSPAS
jgi:serine-type D-Ala-D-Ala carboxypeptidase/endopeptidase